jgi:hypothetical protein
VGGVGREMDIKLVKLQRQETGIPGGVEMKNRNKNLFRFSWNWRSVLLLR